MSSKTLNKVRRLLADFGWWNACLYVFGVLLHKVSTRATLYKYYLIVQPVWQEPLLPIRRNPSVEVRLVSKEEYDLSWFPRPAEVIRSRYDQGAVCFVAFKEGEAIGCLWLLLGPYIEDEVRCRFIPSPSGLTAWDFDVYLQPRYRAGRMFAYLWNAANIWLREQNVQWTMSRINAFNRDSIRSHQRMGAQLVGSTLFICLGALQLLLANVWPYLHFSPGCGSLPKIIVQAPECK